MSLVGCWWNLCLRAAILLLIGLSSWIVLSPPKAILCKLGEWLISFTAPRRSVWGCEDWLSSDSWVWSDSTGVTLTRLLSLFLNFILTELADFFGRAKKVKISRAVTTRRSTLSRSVVTATLRIPEICLRIWKMTNPKFPKIVQNISPIINQPTNKISVSPPKSKTLPNNRTYYFA